jgi:DNA (cytosine-5)-methyltransferase 1
MTNKLKGLSLFSSAGIGETYIGNYVEMKVANELLKNRSEIYNFFYPNTQMINGDITNDIIYKKILDISIKENVDFIYATPPCQSFSKAGKQLENDERDILFLYILKISNIIKPKYIIIENVPEFIKLNIKINNIETNVLNEIQNILGTEYIINYKILNTADFETAQNRKRSIILISKKTEHIWNFPNKKHPLITVRDTIGHLPSLKNNEKNNIHPFHFSKKHNEKHILWMSHTPTGKTAFENEIHFPQKDGRKIKGYNTTYKRIEWDKPAPTITMANGSISSQNNVHPGRKNLDGTYSDARVLSIYELILLTGLQKTWEPPKVSDNLIRQILGECVPPKLIYNLVKELFIC